MTCTYLSPTRKTYFKTITPQEAERILGVHNIHNRHLSDKYVELYRTQMAEERWPVDGSSIRFSKTGRLLDGQHRLWACYLSGHSFMTNVVEGLDDEVFAVIDSGKPRNASDVLNGAEIRNNASGLAAMAHLLIAYHRGEVFHNKSVPRQDLVDYVLGHENMQEWIKLAAKPGPMRRFHVPVAAVTWLGSHKHPCKAEQFVEQFVSGTDLHKGNPVLALRTRFIGIKMQGSLVTKSERFSLTAVAWNAYVADRDITKVQLPHGKGFPKIAGAPR